MSRKFRDGKTRQELALAVLARLARGPSFDEQTPDVRGKLARAYTLWVEDWILDDLRALLAKDLAEPVNGESSASTVIHNPGPPPLSEDIQTDEQRRAIEAEQAALRG